MMLANLGGALEFYDFVFFTAVMGKLFFPPDMSKWLGQLQTFGIFAACCRPTRETPSLRRCC